MRHAAPQLAHALGLHPHEGAACDLGQWRRWGEATPAIGVLEALFCILPRRCRPTLARVGLQGGARAHQEQPVDEVRVSAVRGLTVQRDPMTCVWQQIRHSCQCNSHVSGE